MNNVTERVEYYTNMKRITRADPIARFTLLSIKGEDNNTPILPLQSDDPDALRHSPLFALVNPGDDISEVASNLMGPGPWTLHRDLKLPNSCSQMKPTNRNRKSNITVTHTLKLVMRVARGDDLFIDGKTGKRKQFDVVVQTPVLILSVRFFYFIQWSIEVVLFAHLFYIVPMQSRVDLPSAVFRSPR